MTEITFSNRLGKKFTRVNGVPIVCARSGAGWRAYRSDRNGSSNVYREPEQAVRALLSMYDRPHFKLMRRAERAR